MATVDRVLPWRRHAPIPADEIAPVVDAYRAAPSQGADRHRSCGPTRWRPRPTSTSTASAARSTSTTPSRWPRSWPTSGSTTPPSPPPSCTTPSRTPRSRTAEIEERFGAEVAPDRRRRHQAGADPLRLPGGAAGRHHAQDAGGDGQGPAGPDHQAGRPPAQPAHHRRHAARASSCASAQETLDIYAPLAHRLGMQEIKQQLEDLSFAALHPKRYAEIDSLVAPAHARAGPLPGRGGGRGPGPAGRAPDRRRRHRPAASTCGASTRRWSCGARSSTTSSTWSASGSSSTR